MKDWFSGIRPADLIQRIRSKRHNSSHEDLEDATQDVYLRALERARSHSPPPAPVNAQAYLVRSVHNRLNSMQRSRWREAYGVDPETFETADTDEPGPDGWYEARERAELFGLLASALCEETAVTNDEKVAGVFAELQKRLRDELTARQWILIRMRALEGLGYVECARQLNVSVGTAHKWAGNALDIVREALEACGVEVGALAYRQEEGDES